MGGDSVRGGVRGGRDQFNWEEVKTDKFRECYLGASVKASVGRWQKNRDVLWYTRDGGPGGAQAAADELAAVKGEEERLMQEALGLRPVTQRRGASALDNGELQHMLKRGAGVDGTEEGGGGGAGDDLRVKGVGYTPAVAEHQKSAAQQVKAGEVFDGREVLAGVAQAPLQEREHHGGQGHVGWRAAHRADSDSSSGERRRRRKEAKHARKEAKREAKEARREHRRRSHSPAERRHRSRSRSRSRSASQDRDRDRDRDRRRH